MNLCEDYKWLVESLDGKIVTELENLSLTLGPFYDLSETVLQHALSSSTCKVKVV